MSKLSVLIPCFNSEKTIRATLESVKLADEILVCDSFSTDKTLDIARQYGARIIQHEYKNSATQKNWAIPQCRHDWVLIIDTDETLEDSLKEEIQNKLKENSSSFNAYRIPRKNFVYGRWMKYGGLYPDYQIRLFRQDKARYETREVHAQMIAEGAIGTLRHHFLHNGFKDMREWFVKTERYTHYEADEIVKQNRNFSWVRLILYPFLIFIQKYFLKLGMLDGYPGFLMAVLDSGYYFMMHARLYERCRFK